MAYVYKETHRLDTARDDIDDDIRVASTNSPTLMLARIVYILSGVMIVVLGLRFLMALLGASRGSAFTNFIHSISQPLVAPFFGMFNYQPQVGVARFEVETLFAIVVYSAVTWLLIMMLRAGRGSGEEV